MAVAAASLFPERKRVSFDKAPLVEVICQIRFPPILRIGASVPADFQDRIRGSFPAFSEDRSQDFDLPPQFAEMAGMKPGAVVYNFESSDGKWTLGLAQDFISLSTKSYSRWADFWGRFEGPIQALIELYSPAYASRIGLRYQDAIVPDLLELRENWRWSELLQPYIAAEFANPMIERTAEGADRQARFHNEADGSKVFLRHGLAQLQRGTNRHRSYVIDFDFFTDKQTQFAELKGILDGFNESASRAFQWCITDQLFDALGPREIGD